MKALFLIGLLGMAFPVQADVFKCKDAGGKTVYQETPCETANLKAVGKIAKPVGEPSQEAIEKSQAEIKAFNQRYSDRKKAEQEAAKKENGEQGQDNAQKGESKAGEQ